MEYFWNDQKERPNQHNNNNKPCDEKEYPLLSFKDVHWTERLELQSKIRVDLNALELERL